MAEWCNCERCGADMGLNAGDTKLLGGCDARLCPACRREWGAITKDAPAYARIVELAGLDAHYTDRARAGSEVSRTERIELERDRAQAHREMFELGCEFVKPLKKEGE